jgi:hypothetical protein
VAGDAGSNPAVSSGLSLTQLKKARDRMMDLCVTGNRNRYATATISIENALRLRCRFECDKIAQELICQAKELMMREGIDISKRLFSVEVRSKTMEFVVHAEYVWEYTNKNLFIVTSIEPNTGETFMPDGDYVNELIRKVIWSRSHLDDYGYGAATNSINVRQTVFDLLMAGF